MSYPIVLLSNMVFRPPPPQNSKNTFITQTTEAWVWGGGQHPKKTPPDH